MPFRHNKDKDTVNRRELRIALNERVSGRSAVLGKDSIAFDGFHNAAALTDSVVDDIILNRPAPGEFKTELGPSEMGYDPCGPVETFTEAELAAALKRLGYQYSRHSAGMITTDIRSHREPQWQNGDVVKDATGDIYKRVRSGWWRAGSSSTYSENTPVRPLKRMVEET